MKTSPAELFIPKPYAYVLELKSQDDPNTPMLRVYRNQPDLIAIQVRTHAPIVGGGKPRDMIAGVGLTKDEAMILIARLKHFVEQE